MEDSISVWLAMLAPETRGMLLVNRGREEVEERRQVIVNILSLEREENIIRNKKLDCLRHLNKYKKNCM